MLRKWLRFAFSAAYCGICLFSCRLEAAGQLKRGKYFGGIQMDGSPTQIAVVLDTFAVTAPETPDFPQVDAILRVSPGGFFSAEYVSFRFQNFSYNFQKGVLYLEDPAIDISATLEVTNTDSTTVLEGPVVFRPSLKKGRMRVEMNEDELSPTGAVGFKIPFLPALAGEYRGKCDAKAAALQIETGRESSLSRSSTSGLAHYVVTGRIGYLEDSMCSENGPAFCSQRFFTSADYRFFENTLLLQGPRAALNCTTSGSDLFCRQQILGKNENCTFRKMSEQTTSPEVYPRRFFLKPTAEQKKPLPAPQPPLSEDLVTTLNGSYYGFLHHENRDQYQLIRMGISASSTTIHPHINERVFITASLSSIFGSSWNSSALYGQEFLRKELNIGLNGIIIPYYRLDSEGSDTFLVIEEWKTGYLRGIWYSKEYGRVGTFEFLKEVATPVPANLDVIPSLDGEYEGPTDRDPKTNNWWWLRAIIPGQIPREKRNTATLQGEYESKNGVTVGRAFESGSIDMYTGAVSFVVPENNYARLFTGFLKQDALELIWPGACIWSVRMSDYSPYTYIKVGSAREVQVGH